MPAVTPSAQQFTGKLYMFTDGGFWPNTGYVLSLPVAGYFTCDGVRLDKVGVAPSAATDPAQALDKALELIAKK